MTRQLKNGQYSYLEADQLGKGSFGRVYKGKITETSEVVAIKAIDMADLRKFGE
jgi:serine/threonine protein kinase